MTPAQLASFRHRHGVTQVEMAKAIGTTQSGVSRIERSGDANLSTVTKYLGHLGYVLGVVSLSDLPEGVQQ